MISNIILQGIGGSQAYGTAGPDSDTDRYAIYLAPIREVLGFEDHVKSSHVTEPEDFHSHELEKFLKLALRGNPTITELLWLDSHEKITEVGQILVENRLRLIGKVPLTGAYLGYASQQMRRHSKAPEDDKGSRKRNKHLGHCYRLILQAKGILSTGALPVRLTESEIRLIGEFSSLDPDALTEEFESAKNEVMELMGDSDLPEQPDRAWAEGCLLGVRLTQALELGSALGL